MVRVLLDELRLNAIMAALDERQQRLGAQLARLTSQPVSQSREYAMDSVAMALQHTYLARMTLVDAIPEPEPPADITYQAWTEGELVAGFGK